MLKKIINSIILSMLMVIVIGTTSYAYTIDPKINKDAEDTRELLGGITDHQFERYAERTGGLTVASNKVWTVTLDHKVEITKKTYDYIYVTDLKGTKIPTTLKTKGKGKNVITITSNKPYVYEKEYQLVINKGLKSLDGSVTKKKVIKPFKIEPNKKQFSMFYIGNGNSRSTMKKDEIYNYFDSKVVHILEKYRTDKDIFKTIYWPIIWSKEDMDKIPFRYRHSSIGSRKIIRAGTYYIHGHIKGFDPKNPKYNCVYKLTIYNNLK